MMKTNRIISLLLAVLMLLSSFVMIAAAEDDTPKYTFKTTPTKAATQYFTNKNITSPEIKLRAMDLRLVKDGYRLYVDEYTGEVAVQSEATGETLFTNPYDLASINTTESEKAKLISQLAVTFKDPSTGSSMTYFSANKNLVKNSNNNAARGNNLGVSYIKDGIRIEYSIGTEESRMLLPIWIEKSRFEDLCAAMDENGFKEDVHKAGALDYLMGAGYTLRDPAKAGGDAMYNQFPITKEGVAIYTIRDLSTIQRTKIEDKIKTYAPDYTYEQMDQDHAEVKYEDNEIAPPLFKMALEYTLDEYGVSVRLPANGIRFDETHYQLESIEMLPYMGSGSAKNAGYTFFPDGAGALFDFEECRTLGKTVSIAGKVYGQDYAYHTISGTNQQIIRYPVFGLAETETFTVTDPETKEVSEYTKDRGYVAIIEEGESLVTLAVNHDHITGKNTVKSIVSPRPKDSYNLGDSVSIAANKAYSVVSNRKYTGNYKIRYIMLTDPDVAAEKEAKGTYPCTYYGMAQAYREYLEAEKVLTRLEEDKLADANKLPLYIEALGSLETTEKVLTIPVDVMTPLTTFKDINLMYNDLAKEGITNINFVLNGFTKGGLTAPQIPYKFKWDKSVEEGGVEFDELVEYAREQGFALYPDVDFVFISSNTAFDGLNLNRDAAKTIDNRYASLKEYNATKQTYISYYELLFSSASMSRFYEKFTETFNKKEDPQGISVSTLGSYLSSDFDEDEPYNRDDSELYTKIAFEYLEENYDKIMTSAGNAYSWKYVDYITDVATDSSRYRQSSASVPFLGIVLHGYVETAGTAINMEGNIDYAMLKAIENGSALKFILAYRNTEKLKDDFILNKYYSIEYKVWESDIIKLYDEINNAIGDLQTSRIVKHEFVKDVVRVPDADEIERDAKDAVQAEIEAEILANIAASEAERNAILNARKAVMKYGELLSSGKLGEMLNTDFTSEYLALLTTYNNTKDSIEAMVDAALVTDYKNAEAALQALIDAETDETSAEYKAAKKELQTATKAITDYLAKDKDRSKAYKEAKTKLDNTLKEINTFVEEKVYTFYDELIATVRGFNEFNANAADYKEIIQASALNESYKQELVAQLDAVVAASALYTDAEEAKLAELETLYNDIKATFADEFTVEAYEYVEKEASNPETENNVVNDNRYAADKNKVVYEEFENGKAFILNFNNYGVVVVYDDVTYTLDAYDYLVVKKAK